MTLPNQTIPKLALLTWFTHMGFFMAAVPTHIMPFPFMEMFVQATVVGGTTCLLLECSLSILKADREAAKLLSVVTCLVVFVSYVLATHTAKYMPECPPPTVGHRGCW